MVNGQWLLANSRPWYNSLAFSCTFPFFRPMNILELQPIAATRRNHALEHATIHILSGYLPAVSMAGRANSRGFFIYGDLHTEALRQAVREAIQRMTAGESYLAIHPNCGTNLVTTAIFSATATMLAIAGKRRHLLDRIPTGLLGALAGVFLGQMVGLNLQERITTCAELDVVKVVQISRREIGRRVLHWVQIAHEPAG